MKLWIARDRYGELSLHSYQPIYRMDKYDNTDYWTGGRIGELPISFFPEVTFENSPQEVELLLSNLNIY